jgi:iron(III) transport system substrate-binding protein
MVMFACQILLAYIRHRYTCFFASLFGVVLIGNSLMRSVAYGGTVAPNQAVQALIAAAQKDGVLNILGSGDWHDTELISSLQKGLNGTYGINIRLNVTPGPSASKLLPRLLDEYKTGRKASTDIFFAPARQQIPMEQAGVLHHVDWKKLMPALRDDEIGLNESNVVVGAAIHVIGYNTKLLSTKDLPKTYKDFTNPKYKGKIGTTVYGVGWVEAAIYLGEKEATRIVDAMVKNGSIVGTTDSGAQNRVATGEFLMFAFDTQPASYTRLKEKGAAVDFATLDDFLSGTASGASVPKNSAHPELAKLLALYMLTTEGQKTIWNVIGRDSPYREGSNLHKLVEQKRATGATIYFATDQQVQKNQHYYTKVARYLSAKLRGE